MTIIDYLKRNSSIYPEHEAIIFKKEGSSFKNRDVLTWREFDTLSNKISVLLTYYGIKKGSHVAIIATNCLEWIPIFFAILQIGAVAIPINPQSTKEELLYCLNKTECEFAIIHQKIDGNYFKDNSSIVDIITIESLYNINIHKKERLQVYEQLTGDDNAAIFFSSGTTGKPKAILLSHGAFLANGLTEFDNHHQNLNDRLICFTPLFHTGILVHWLGNLISGGCIVIDNTSSMTRIANTIEYERITIAWLVVPHMRDILDLIKSGVLSKEMFSSLRLVHSGSQPIPIDLVLEWKLIFNNCEYDISYGLTEACGPGCLDIGLGTEGKYGTVGKPSKGWDVKIINEERKEVNCGEIGELILKGPGLMKCYFNDKKATKEVLKKGWLYTGDLASRDEEGFIRIVGRKKEVIIVGGENIYPVEIENFYKRFSFIKDVVAFGIPNRRLGESLAILVELKENHCISKVDFCNISCGLPANKRPIKVYFGSVKRNANKKVDKSKIIEELLG